jgi:4'-phosphopantetheinyl transferase EntD
MKFFHSQALKPNESSDLLSEALGAMAGRLHRDLVTGCRQIAPADDRALSPREALPLSRAVPAVRCATGAGRIVARRLLASLGAPDPVDLARLASGAPDWPQGYTGSISHDDRFAVAALVRQDTLAAVGIDVEPPLPLPAELVEMVATPMERRQLGGDLLRARLLFSIKEAVYKATNPHDGVFLDHHDVEVCFSTRTAHTSTGRRLAFEAILAPRIVALATDFDEPALGRNIVVEPTGANAAQFA